MPSPDFFIIGAAKAGTTSLHAILERHPDIFASTPKEPEFLARDDRYREGLDQYLKLFDGARPGQRVGEASTLYSLTRYFPETPARMAAHFPEAQIIYILRDPVDRAYSYYAQIVKAWQNHTGRHVVNRRFEEMVFDDARAGAAAREEVFSRANDHLPDEPDLCLAGSDYADVMEAYLQHFARDRMLVLLFEDMLADRDAFLRRITDFLGVRPMNDVADPDEAGARNMARQHYAEVEATRAAAAARGKLGPAWALRKILPASLRQKLKPLLARGVGGGLGDAHVPPPMTEETRARLAARYSADRARLEALTGLDLGRWRSFL